MAVLLALSVMVLLAAQATTAAATSSCGTQRPVWTPNPGNARPFDRLVDVAVLDTSNIVAVGDSAGRFGIAERWDGSAWHNISEPRSAATSGRGLWDVARIDDDSAWAVGSQSGTAGPSRTLVQRLDGSTWTTIASPDVPDPEADDILFGVDAISATDAWAVGSSKTQITELSNRYDPLAVHWDGAAWTLQPMPTVDDGGILESVAMVSATDGWAVGSRGGQNEGAPRTLIEHWDGSAWRIVPSPSPGPFSDASLSGVAARSTTDVVAVGTFGNASRHARPLAIHWDGMAWTRMPVASPGKFGWLTDVTVGRGGSAYAVGTDGTGRTYHALVVRWDGSRWIPMPIATSSADPMLSGVAIASPANVMSVGQRTRDGGSITFAVHCTP